MVKSGLEFFIFKLNKSLQSYCCLVQKNWSRKAEWAWQVSRYISLEGLFNFEIKDSIPFFTIIFKPKMVISRVKSLVIDSYPHADWRGIGVKNRENLPCLKWMVPFKVFLTLKLAGFWDVFFRRN